ncbi:hypothetical protein LRS06_01145 [Hymenobacter sp. J193]|uniref:hypothetical protein n=1 Tax=Hymenobacter sp. J193 TaxID=2898429 RepID=UPI002150D995|nr:hypothetical protein [Hymenobacter sp. J193]MCR5886399.1 hypothetical protein [Hymenobacter sp. J193]
MKTFCLFIGYGLAAALFLAAYAAMFASLRGMPCYPLPRLRAQPVAPVAPAAYRPQPHRLVEPAFYKSRQPVAPRKPALLLANAAAETALHLAG